MGQGGDNESKSSSEEQKTKKSSSKPVDLARGGKGALMSDEEKNKSARLKMFDMCNMFEDAAAEMLVYALNNPIDQQAILAKRQETLQALYKLRFLSDVDDDFSQLEFEGEMRKIKTFRLKMQRLQEKEDVDRDTEEEESSSDSEGEDEHLDIMKEARKNLAYTFGQQIDSLNENAKNRQGLAAQAAGGYNSGVLAKDKTWHL